jgi:hypothetical protein
MARRKEPGIIYYSMEADHTQHPKVRLLFNEFGSDGYWIWSCLLDRIYKAKGYYFDTRDVDDLELFASDVCKKPLTQVLDVIKGAVRRDLFNKVIFEKHGILTSDRVQLTYLKATEERRRKGTDIELFNHLCLISEDLNDLPYNSRIILLSMDSSTEISDSSTEELNNSTEQSANKSIVKKSRVKKSKEDKRINDGSDEPKNYSSDDQVLFTAFTEWIHKHAPTVGKMEEPFSIDQYLKLKKKGFTREQTQAYLIKMHNYKPLTKKNRSAYLTLLNWDRMQKDRDGGNNQNNKESAEKSMVI